MHASAAARAIAADLTPQIAWLMARPPEHCYGAPYNIMLRWMTETRDAFVNIDHGVGTPEEQQAALDQANADKARTGPALADVHC